ncbi:ATP-binding cassette domain-containing protein [Paenibacillus solisilvae]|uniref:ATP-binding cassette domain-containing protein n=1 Tax=Paenibacillus solisilvae TaxID=2486751 RepID=A0ABW0VZK6_9BACL
MIKYVRAFTHSVVLLYRIERRPVWVLAAALLLSVPIIPVEMWLIKTLVDRIQAWEAPDSIVTILIVAAELALLMVIGNIALGVPVPMAMTRLMEIGPLVEQRLIMQKNAALPFASLERPATKNLLDRAQQVSHHDTVITGFQMVQLFLQFIIIIALLLVYGQWIPIVILGAAAIFFMHVSNKSAEQLEGLTRNQTEERRVLHHYSDLMTKRAAAKEIRLFGLARLLTSRWTSLYEEQSEQQWSFVKTSEFRKLLPELLMALLSGLLLAIIIIFPGAHQLTSGDCTLLFLAMTMLFSQLPNLIGQGASMRKYFMRWEDFHDFMELEEDRTIEVAGECAAGNGLALQVRDISYRYPGAERDTICGVSLTIPSGCRAALVGENGSGKSTLVKLLTGLYEPTGGVMEWGKDGAHHSENSFASGHLSAVFQDFSRFYLTLRENLALGKLSAMEQDSILQGSLDTAGSKFGHLDMQLGTAFGGIEPSGGEWQRIATARSLLRDSAFVFFDEPTAALDPQAERDAFDLFLRVTRGRSALLVTHRLGAAKLADVIFVLKQGRVVERGTHAELMSQEGEYSKMFQLQASWYV